MTTIQSNSGVSTSLMDAVNGNSSAKAKDTVVEAQDRFMTLLVTQMRNQDPLNPMDNAQMTSQLAQLSTVSGIEKLNAALENLMGSYQASQTLQATGMIGHGVLATGNSVQLSEGEALMGVELAGPADKVQVTIRDASGTAVHSFALENQAAGTYPLAWDGKNDAGTTLPDGKYTFDVKATAGEQSVTATALSFGQVASVSTGSGGIKVNVPTLGALNFADIRQIL
ncbi:flagellar hook assembly protein FlgD [Janthinobacterium sp. 17J80-10]|uniref:flagellar hook assembly protein FlgD n=1 Tax=Janthinobacterium sp. 17J80-10 TaxID=2497863 RepID=UPI001005491E|nr:flagellar hook assembly protein FlgD [Janthinobacterium sp. 17J80-10]QAU34344.1 flagellar hook assembly protein FlgD [Janthinobacterium sp. 17J80-10]